MLNKVYDNFKKGIEKIRWFATLFAERLNIEIAVLKLLHQSEEMTQKRATLLRAIGEQVVALNEHPEKNVFRDSVIAGALEEIE